MKTIKLFVQQIVETLSTVLQVEITVVDRHLERIAGTGRFKAEIGKKIPRSFILSQAIETGSHYIAEHPGKSLPCEHCLNYDHCIETAVIALPVMAGNRILGGIGLVAFDKRQRTNLLRNKHNLLAFVRHFSELISTKALEQELTQKSMLLSEQLRSVIDAINQGIIVIDDQGNVSLLNSYAKRKIDHPIQTKLLGEKITKFLPESTLDHVLSSTQSEHFEKGTLKLDANSIPIIFSHVPVHMGNRLGGAILLFHVVEDVPRLINQISEATDKITFDDILGLSAVYEEAKSKARITARSGSTVLLLGESGTGKELFARAIHSSSDRRQGPFVAVNCAAIPDTLLESELFGYETGAFTGARKQGKPGKFELANRGTILLDEIGDLTTTMQAKLLRILEDKNVERIGGTRSIRVDLRIIASTSRDVEQMVEKGDFRGDLYYRISAVPIRLPPLRERKEDIPVYLDYFLRHFNGKLGRDVRGFAKAALSALQHYHWPGNTRELKNAVEYAVNMEPGPYITIESLPERVKHASGFPDHSSNSTFNEERSSIIKKLAKHGKTTEAKKLAANELGISLATFYRKMTKYGLH
jgi:transcriptional regulator with PAS, ATPase and Fis domain